MTVRVRPHPVGMLTAVIMAMAGLTGCNTGGAPGKLVVLGSWTGGEQQVFQAVLDEFGAQHGVEVDYQGTRDVSQALRSLIEEGQSPDVVIMPSAGDLAAHQAEFRSLEFLETAPEDSPNRMLRDANRPYAIAVKTTLKSIVWFDPRVDQEFVQHPPANWSELRSAAAAASALRDRAGWCIGLGATSQAGWAGTDWIEDILLHQAGPGEYADWASGRLSWTSPSVEKAWETFGGLFAPENMVLGGRTGALLTTYDVAGTPLLQRRCRFHHQGSFMAGLLAASGSPAVGAPESPAGSPGARASFDFFPFPESESRQGSKVFEVSSDFAALMTDDQNAVELLRYLTPAAGAQRLWFEQGGASAVPADGDHGLINDKLAALANASTLCLDASDTMPPELAAAFERAVLEFVAGKAELKGLLRQLEELSRPFHPPQQSESWSSQCVAHAP
ncbi:ABC transporter substrate-binding protein [Catellatospora sp. TT07R-123]|uniref:ABC transporter substrate-binding protein n=1 Tax=Catellatospora sp. TT07R-123 TaxID=2733863 RepID=UPI001B0A1CC9|nr:ABC transporter substrate-binding protein [Catellatospora sp. TT07R-123]GHJ43562.1 ABC transporter substrate-binding protein [Catellatospora sp. TT07R-123]